MPRPALSVGRRRRSEQSRRIASRPVGGLSGVQGRPKCCTQTARVCVQNFTAVLCPPSHRPYLQTLTTPPMPTLIQCRRVARYTLELSVVGEVEPLSSLEQSLQLTPTGVRHNPQLTGNEWFISFYHNLMPILSDDFRGAGRQFKSCY